MRLRLRGCGTEAAPRRSSRQTEFDPSTVSAADRLATNNALYRFSLDDVDHFSSLNYCDGVLALQFDSDRSKRIAKYLTTNWLDDALTLQAAPGRACRTVRTGWADSFDYTAAGRADRDKQSKETCSLRGSVLKHALDGGLPGLNELVAWCAKELSLIHI